MYNTKKYTRNKKKEKLKEKREKFSHCANQQQPKKSRIVDNFPNYFSFHLEQFFMLDLKWVREKEREMEKYIILIFSCCCSLNIFMVCCCCFLFLNLNVQELKQQLIKIAEENSLGCFFFLYFILCFFFI